MLWLKRIKTIFLVCLSVMLLLSLSGCKNEEEDYAAAKELFLAEKYPKARAAFSALDDYEDSKDFVRECDYRMAMAHYEDEDYETAAIAFRALGKYKQSVKLAQNCDYQLARELYDSGNYEAAIRELSSMGNYKNCVTLVSRAEDILTARSLSGKWERPIDLTDAVREKLASSEAVKKLEGDFMKYVDLGEFKAVLELRIDEDGIIAERVKDTSSKRTTKSMQKIIRDGLAVYAEDYMDAAVKAWGITLEEYKENVGVSNSAELFEQRMKKSLDAYADELFPKDFLESLIPKETGLGLVRVEQGDILFKLDGIEYQVELDAEGKTLTLTEPVDEDAQEEEEEPEETEPPTEATKATEATEETTAEETEETTEAAEATEETEATQATEATEPATEPAEEAPSEPAEKPGVRVFVRKG